MHKFAVPRNLFRCAEILSENLKPLPAANAIVDKCIECGFCETVCPSKNLTLTPRQRIAVQREICRLRTGDQTSEQLKKLVKSYRYQGDQTCATDGLCKLACPVEINTGELTKELRRLAYENTIHAKGAALAAEHFALLTRGLRLGLNALDKAHTLFGTVRLNAWTTRMRQMFNGRLPLWNRYMPRAVLAWHQDRADAWKERRVVYFPSCIARTMGPAQGDPDKDPLPVVTQRVLGQAGFQIIYPEKMEHLCCGMPFESKGLKQVGLKKARELEQALLQASQMGTYPILCDTSPCLFHMRETLDRRLNLYEPIEFIHAFLMDRLDLHPMNATIAIHTTCSSQKMGLAPLLMEVAQKCATAVIVPDRVGCCGFAGDRGFSYPELNASALEDLASAVGEQCSAGYSNSRTCEIGLSLHSGIYYKSIMYLLDRCIRKGE